MRIWTLVLVNLFALCAPAAIVDTLRGFDEDALGWRGELKADFAARGGNSEVLQLSGSGRLQWQNPQHRVRALLGAERIANGAQTIGESALAHLRHNVRLRPRLYSLLFVQQQRAPFQQLETRSLLGAGFRLDVLQREKSRVALGAAHMFERERLEDAEATTAQRLSAFALVRLLHSEAVNFELGAFAQPRWNDFEDLRAVTNAALEIELAHDLSLVLAALWQHDQKPPAGVERNDWGTTVGLSWELGAD